MPAKSTVGSINVTDLLDALRELGADPRKLMARAGLSAAALKDPDARVPSSKLLMLFQAAEQRLRDPLVGLHAAERARTRGPLFYLLLSSPRFSEGLRLFTQFARVPLDTQTVASAVDGDVVSLTIDPGDPAIVRSRHAVDYLMRAVLGSIRRAVPGLQPIGVDLTHEPFGDKRESERAFGCPVRFDRPQNALRFPAATLKRAPAASNPAIARQIKSYTAALLARVSSDRLEIRAADAVRMLLVDGIPADLSSVARRLFMSERTIKRRLQEEGTSFKAVRDRVRAETAAALLSNRALKVGAVARSVGFAEPASFTKAFTRWSGCSPARYRAQASSRRRAGARLDGGLG